MKTFYYRFTAPSVSVAMLFCLAFTPSFSQFQMNYGTSSENAFSKVIPTGTGYYVLGQDDLGTGTLSYATVTCLNANGQHQWTLSMDIPSRWNDAVLAPNGDLLVVGSTLPFDPNSQSLMACVTKTGGGSFTWLRRYNEQGRDAFNRIVENPVPENPAFPYYVLGTQNQPGTTATTEDVVLMNVDKNGNFNWKKSISTSGDDEWSRDLEALANGNLLLAGNNAHGEIFMTDNTGLVIGGVQIQQEYFIDVAREATGGVYGAANSFNNDEAFIMKFDQDLLLSWHAKIPQLKTVSQIWEASPNIVYVTGRGNFGGADRDVVIKLGENPPLVPTVFWVKYLNAGSGYTGGTAWHLPPNRLAFSDARVLPGGFGGLCAFISVSNLEIETCMVSDTMASLSFFDPLPDGPLFPFTEPFPIPMGVDFPGFPLMWLQDTVCTNDTCNVEIVVTHLDNCGLVQLCANSTGADPYSFQWCDGRIDSCFTTQLDCGQHDFCVSVTCADGTVSSALTVVTISDTVPPTANCASGVVVALDTNCMATLTVADIDENSFDNCRIDSMSISPSVLDSCGEFQVTLLVIDWCGNKDSCTTIVTAEDKVPPIIMCPPNVQVACDKNVPPSLTGIATATDNCDPSPLITFSDIANGLFPCDGVIQRTWTAEDDCGNQATCVQNILVFDNVPPVLTNCPPNVTVAGTLNPAGVCEANVQVTSPIATDNCDTSLVLTNSFNNTANASSIYPQGTTTVVWTVSDDCGNMDTCSFVVTVECVIDSCTCLGFDSLAFYQPPFTNNDGYNIPVTCNNQPPQLLPWIPNDGYYPFIGNLLCSDSCDSKVDYTIISQATGLPVTNGTALSYPIGNNTTYFEINPGIQPIPGNYQLSLTGHCGADSCICIIDFIVPDCDTCGCGTYSDISYRPFQGAPNINAVCEDTLIAQCDGLIPWTLGGNYQCAGTGCPPATQMYWMLTAPNGSVSIDSMTADPGFNITIPASDFDTTGCFQLTLKAICGNDTCYCDFVVKVECDTCCTDFDAFCQRVENAVTITVDNDSCKATFNIGDLGGCNDYIEYVNWGNGNTDNGPFSSGDMPMHVYLGSGTYEVCYLAIELDAAGFICFEKFVCDTIDVICDKCCTDSVAFFTAAPNIQTFGTLGDCLLNFNAELDSCWQISYLWGDLPATWQGPFGNNVSVSHIYANEGTYSVCYRLEEVDENGNICWEYEKCEDVFVLCPDSCATVPTDIIGWWPMEDQDGDIEVVDIIGGHNGTPQPGGVVGSPNGPFTVPGKVGNALHFVSPGNSHAVVSNSPALNFGAGSFSIDAWIYTDMGTQTEPIVDKLGNTNTGYSFSIQGTNPYFLTLVLGTGTSVNVLSGPAIVPGEWNFVAVTVSPAMATFYVKNSTGFMQSTALTGTYNATNNSRPLLIGNNPFNLHWNIMIDELELFNRALDSLELIEICEADSLGKCPPVLLGCSCTTLSGNVSSGFTFSATGPGVYLFQPPLSLKDTCDQVTWDWGDGSSVNVTNGSTPVEHSFLDSEPTNVCMTIVRTQEDGSTCTEEFCLEVTSADDLEWEGDIMLFPNPTSGGLTLEFLGAAPHKGQLQILDLYGRVILGEALLSNMKSHHFSVSTLPTGMYFVQVTEGGVPVWAKKLVKQ